MSFNWFKMERMMGCAECVSKAKNHKEIAHYKCKNCGEIFVIDFCRYQDGYLCFNREYGLCEKCLKILEVIMHNKREKYIELKKILAFNKNEVIFNNNLREKSLIGEIMDQEYIKIREFYGEKFQYGGTIEKYEKCPKNNGIYLIINENINKPIFVEPSPAGKKIKAGIEYDPTVNMKFLNKNWVNNTQIVYIGKAENITIYERMKQHYNFWSGKKNQKNAWGGRILAQIKDYEKLQIWFQECNDSKIKESTLLKIFEDEYGKLPFANLKH